MILCRDHEGVEPIYSSLRAWRPPPQHRLLRISQGALFALKVTFTVTGEFIAGIQIIYSTVYSTRRSAGIPQCSKRITPPPTLGVTDPRFLF